MGQNRIYFSLSGCSAGGSALDWGSRGRRFKSCHSEEKGFVKETLQSLFAILKDCPSRRMGLLAEVQPVSGQPFEWKGNTMMNCMHI